MNAGEGSTNLRSLFVVWWYREVSAKFFNYLKHFFAYLLDLFSVKICFSTLFSPWKRDSISTEGLNIQDRFQVLMMNLASRLVGAVIKLGTIATFCIFSIFFFIASIILSIVWLLYPILLVFLIGYGIKLILS